jgi:methylated-DNA-[protein]-cysteine S-methyltransferase
MNHAHIKLKTPVGKLTLVASEKALVAILWENEKPKRVKVEIGPEKHNHPILLETKAQLEAYFSAERTDFELPLAPQGSPFQVQVWHALATIPYGQTLSYGELAQQVGSPHAARAVGAANSKNPLSIVLPCHRVIGANGKLTGFAGGLEVKAQLLTFERDALPIKA